MTPDFERGDMAEQVELRGGCPRWIVEIVDAVALSRKESRVEVVNSILESWAANKKNEATLICRVTRSNGKAADAGGRGAE